MNGQRMQAFRVVLSQSRININIMITVKASKTLVMIHGIRVYIARAQLLEAEYGVYACKSNEWLRRAVCGSL